MLDMIIKRMWTLEGRFTREALHSRVQLLESGQEAGFQNSIEIINTLKYFSDDTSKLLKIGSRHTDAVKHLVEVVATHNVFLGRLIPLEEAKGTTTRHITNLAGKFDDVYAIFHCLEKILNSKEFSISEAETMQASIRECQHNLKKNEERVHDTMISKARVLMSTIGSSHKLPVRVVEDDGNDNESDLDSIDVDSLTGQFDRVTLSEHKMIVIFDEAGCIPSYELVGLSRVNGNIEALVAVGDKYQLPPYNPNQNHTGKKNGSYHRQRRQAAPTKIKSILDVSKLKIDGGTKKKLTIQYRVPRDIAAVLNDRIYKGDYTTPAVSNVPAEGFCLLDVVQSERNEKYVNKDEVQMCLQMVTQLLNEGNGNIMLLTPVRENIMYMFVYRC
jgi:hypothetical protein